MIESQSHLWIFITRDSENVIERVSEVGQMPVSIFGNRLILSPMRLCGGKRHFRSLNSKTPPLYIQLTPSLTMEASRNLLSRFSWVNLRTSQIQYSCRRCSQQAVATTNGTTPFRLPISKTRAAFHSRTTETFRSPSLLRTTFRHNSIACAPLKSPTVLTPQNSSTDQSSSTEREVAAYEITFTCKPCKHRSAHRISKQGYHQGTVLITCPKCKNRHVISDHLKVSNGLTSSSEL